MRRYRVIACATLAIGLCAVIGGCSGAADPIPGAKGNPALAPTMPAAGDLRAPVIAQSSVTPTTLRFVGGPVEIRADVTDNVGVQAVWAEVAGTGTLVDVALAPASASTYAGTWMAPVNPSEQGVAQAYTVRIGARDGAGNAAMTEAFTVTVQPIPTPPQDPGF